MTPRKKATPPKGPAKKRAPAHKAPRKRKPTGARAAGTIAPFVEEIEVALGELRRLSSELMSTRRQFVAGQSTERGAESSLKEQLEGMRTELKTARAELEIAQANARRIESRLEAAAEAEVRARESQREAEHAADRARDELLWLRREADRKVAPATPAPSGESED